jgi:SpoVK/Ycf46/Vps4 family AAA+-type ATPase
MPFQDMDAKVGLRRESPTIVKSKRPGRIKASNVLTNGHQELCLGDGVQEMMNGVDLLAEKHEDTSPSDRSLSSTNDDEVRADDDDGDKVLAEEDKENVEEHMEHDKHIEQEQAQVNAEEKGVGAQGQEEDHQDKGGLTDKIMEDKKKLKSSSNTFRKVHVKEGRRCGLCGGGTDGKPPKPLAQDKAGSDSEAYSGSSASEEPNYDVWDGFGDEPNWLGVLLGPINDRHGIARIWVHQHCAVWSPEVYFAGLKCLKNVRAALCRGRALKCSRCGRSGATIGCRVDRCSKTYHLPCARTVGCIFDHRKFLIACTDHRRIFQPQGSKYAHRLKKLKLSKMKMELRKLSSDAWRRDQETEEKWFGDDEEFLKRESKRLHRDLLRISPVYIGGSSSNDQNHFQGWESVAGLQNVIRCLKEAAILPLLYPEFFSNCGITPPRGVLLHGYPGTGKTHVVRALIGACSRGDKRIAYFARKGADCLGKYVGDAERQLRLLFQVAEKSQPSIIFFDEIDGLAPSRSNQQDQTHSSVVSTLLALMDGLKNRGSVVVIGATNRPDAVDPALRRPGRFDREIYFPLPDSKDREDILSLHTKNWPKPVAGSLLKWIARKTVGFAGADLQALCTQTAMIALKRSCMFQKLLSLVGGCKRPPLPAVTVEERDWLEALSRVPPPCSLREAGSAASDVAVLPLPEHLVPCLLKPLCRLLVAFDLDERVYLPAQLSRAVELVKNVFVSKRGDCWRDNVDDMLLEADVINEISSELLRDGVLVGDDSFGDADVTSDVASRGARDKSGFRILISGDPGSGQRHLASCILRCFVGNFEIRKIDLATIRQQGHGDAFDGLTQILTGCTNGGSCIIFMPRIDTWAVESCSEAEEAEMDNPPIKLKPSQTSYINDLKPLNIVSSASHLWDMFIEQVELIRISMPLMIMATSEVLFPMLPPRIREFFGTGGLSSCTVPRFSVQVDSNFNRDKLIDSSISKLSRNLAKYLVQLIHQRTHISVPDPANHDEKASDRVENEPEKIPSKFVSSPSKKLRNQNQICLFEIATFGYQILRHHQFAELCWVSSKLKQGPCVEIEGPLKSWPFNPCISCANDSSEKVVVVTCSSINLKSNEKYGTVRGLTAVGLLAYRGTYKSIKEVSSDVRKVLELLVQLINSKVQAGKEKCRFRHLLMQVALLHDMVNTWVYSLRSLDADAEATDVNPNLEQPLDKLKTCIDSVVPSEVCKTDVVLEESGEKDDSAPPPVILKDVNLLKTGTSFEAGEGSSGIHTEVNSAFVEHSNGLIDLNGTSSSPSPSRPDSDLACFYSCCSECLFNLRNLIKQILVRQLGTHWKIDDAHNIISSVSAHLHLEAFRADKKVFEAQSCKCKNKYDENEGFIMAVECACHSRNESGLMKSNQMSLGSKYICKSGVVAELGDENDVLWHCKFQSICLCSLIEWFVVTTKQPAS